MAVENRMIGGVMYPLLIPGGMTPPPEEMMKPPCADESSSIMPPRQDTPRTGPHGEPLTPESLPKSLLAQCSSVTSTSTTNGDYSRLETRVRRRSTAASDLIFSPHPLEDLYRERAYLSSALQTQARRATDLIRQYTSVDEQFQLAELPKMRRRLKKKLHLLRSKLNETAQQERTMLFRLSELTVELRSHEIWMQAQWERSFRHYASPATGLPCSIISPTSVASLPTPLNATCPEFVPRWDSAESNSMASLLETVEEGAEYASACERNESPFEANEEEETESQRSYIDSGDIVMTPGREKRLSLPHMQSPWL